LAIVRHNNRLTPTNICLVQVNETFSEKGCVMLVNWKKDVDAAFAEAKAQNRPLLIDFSAAPA